MNSTTFIYTYNKYIEEGYMTGFDSDGKPTLTDKGRKAVEEYQNANGN